MLSDHEIIEWKYDSREREVDKVHVIRGWSLVPLIGSMEDEKWRREVVAGDWWRIMARRMALSDEDERERSWRRKRTSSRRQQERC
jgi:hypothetical protein